MARTINLDTLYSPEEEQFNQAFGELSFRCRDGINDIKNNKSDTIGLKISSSNSQRFKDQAWQLLGGYIANNTHLRELDLNRCNLTDQKMALLFGGLIKSGSIRELDIQNNECVGIEGVRCMVPFLESSRKLSSIDFSVSSRFEDYHYDSDSDQSDSRFNSECFEV